MAREELGLQKSGPVIDVSKNGEGASGHLPLFSSFAENGLLCCDRAFAFFRFIRDFSLVRRQGYAFDVSQKINLGQC